MAKIALSKGGYTPISEGLHVFKVISAEYDEDFGKLELEMVIKNGQKHKERFTLVNNQGEPNEKAINAFSYFAKTCLNNFDVDEIDHDDLVGCYIECEVTHDVQPNKNDSSKTVTFLRLGDKKPASEFEGGEDAPTPKTKKKSAVNLDDLF